MRLEPSVLTSVRDVEIGAVWAVLTLAIVVAVVTSIAAVTEARRGPSTAAGWLSGLALVAIIVAAILVGSASAARAAEICIASHYGVGDRYHGRRAADGSIFNTYARDPYTVAHRSHRFGTMLLITNLVSGRSIRAKVTDRGPFVAGRCVDLGRAGADALGIVDLGRVRVETVP